MVKQRVEIISESNTQALQKKVNEYIAKLEFAPIDVTFNTSFYTYEGGETFPRYVAYIRHVYK
jgi:hypothetical protein